jgi:DNA primase
MLKIIKWPRTCAERYHRSLPDEIRQYLKGRGIPATYIEKHLLGWDESRESITVPILGRERNEVVGLQYAKPPANLEGAPEMIPEKKNAKPNLYGWDTIAKKPSRVVITDNEFDRLVLEANGFLAVSSTAGAAPFLPEWVPFFKDIRHVYICFSADRAKASAAKELQALLPGARIVKLPPGVRDVTEFFVTLRRTKVDFEVLLAAAAADEGGDEPPKTREFRPYEKALQKRAERVKKAVPLHKIVEESTTLQASDGHLVANCPFHDDREMSFAVYWQTDTYHCSVCGANGDVIRFLMDKESMTYGQALEALECFEFTNELYSAAS